MDFFTSRILNMSQQFKVQFVHAGSSRSYTTTVPWSSLTSLTKTDYITTCAITAQKTRVIAKDFSLFDGQIPLHTTNPTAANRSLMLKQL